MQIKRFYKSVDSKRATRNTRICHINTCQETADEANHQNFA